MNLEDFRTYCLDLKGTSEGFPFDQNTLVFKVMGKIFALMDVENFSSVNLKCDPERAIELRESYEGIVPGYHMNKKHWNTVSFRKDVNDQLILELVDHSYGLVVSSLTKKLQNELQAG